MQPRYCFTVGFRGSLTSHMFIVPQCYSKYYFHSETMSTVTVTDYLAVGTGSAPSIWVVVPDMYKTHLKHGQHLQPISFNNLEPRLTRVVGIVWDASTACGNWCSLT